MRSLLLHFILFRADYNRFLCERRVLAFALALVFAAFACVYSIDVPGHAPHARGAAHARLGRGEARTLDRA